MNRTAPTARRFSPWCPVVRFAKVPSTWNWRPLLKPPIPNTPVVAMDYRVASFGDRPKKIVAAVTKDGPPSLTVAESKLNMFTRKTTTTTHRTDLPLFRKGLTSLTPL